MENIKRNSKDSIFRNIFKEKENLVDLYYDISGNILKADDIRVLDLENYILNSLKNDLSFLTSDNKLIVLIEHQSSVNYNMDIRLLLYYSRLLEKYINERYERGLHTSKKIELPSAEFYILYNGKTSIKDKKSLKTTIHIDGKEIDLGTRIIDINYDKLSDNVINRKDALSAYAYLIKRYNDNIIRIREKEIEKQESLVLIQAFTEALDECIKKGLYPELFGRKEFKAMALEALSFEEELEVKYEMGKNIGFMEGMEEGREEGRIKGREEGRIKGREEERIILVKSMLANGIDKLTVSKCSNVSLEDIEKLIM